MADNHVLTKVHVLSDTELACLLSLIGSEHCIISTPVDALDDLTTELQLISQRTFGLKSAIVECTPHTTLDDFASSLLLHTNPPSPTASRSLSPYLSRSAAAAAAEGGATGHGHDSYFPAGHVAFAHYTPSRQKQYSASISPLTPAPPPNSQMANIIIAKNLDRAPKAVQIQALELLRTKRIFTRTSVQTAPKTFMLVAVLGADSGGDARVTAHLNDFFYVSHWVDPEDEGFALLDGNDDESFVSSSESAGGADGAGDDGASIASTLSVVKRKRRSQGGSTADVMLFRSPKYLAVTDGGANKPPVFSPSDISHLRQLSERTSVDIDVTRYQMNIVSFLRMHRAVGAGISPQATQHFEQLMKSLAPLHGLDYVTPALVQLAARKVYLHRITMAEPARERSMQWGSEIRAIEMLLEGWGPEDVIEEVLEMVAAPV
ncbi:Uncharacterized protein YeaC [Cytospora mali]|uniref:magnesium chelatase n=1 Tax=Cytospora mali TaxID=578113 RepID=A0A194VK96_CYTMA|nr:Uncharacterized protein YeaC [Valsa mali]